MQFGLPQRLFVCLMSALFVCPFLSGGTSLAQNSVTHTPSAPLAKLTLRVYNYARTDPASLTSAEKVADAILEKAGIEATWVNCPLSPKEVQAYPSCSSEMGTADLVLRILPRRMAIKLRHPNEPLGFAQVCGETEPACEFNIFYHQIEDLATKGYRADRILGYVFSHEIAHVLLGPAHSEQGIMRGEWTSFDLQYITWGLPLTFTADQSLKLRLALLHRSTPSTSNATTQASHFAP